MVPMAALALNASISFCLSALLVMMVTECPFWTRFFASGWLIWPNEPVKVIFIFLFLVIQSWAMPPKQV
jgi:hypothetical protein